MYLELFHGRTTPDQQLDDWGQRGPVIGPLQYVHTTYGTDVKFAFTDKSKADGWLIVIDGLIYYNGLFFGDWSSFEKLSPEHTDRLVDFDQNKAAVPALRNQPAADDALVNILTAINGFAFQAQESASDQRLVRERLQQILDASDRATALYREYHILRLHGGIEPEIIGPFPSEDARDRAAIAFRRENDEDVILSMDGPGASVQIDAYSAGFLSEELDAEA